MAKGVEHLQMLGARYYLAFSPEAVAQADANPDLTLVGVRPASGGPTRSGARRSSSPLANQPAVITGGGKGEREWMAVMADWYQDFGAHDVFLAASGPKEWQRVKVNKVVTDVARPIGSDVEVDTAERRPLDPVVVSGITHQRQPHHLRRRPGRACRCWSRPRTSPAGRCRGPAAPTGCRPT